MVRSPFAHARITAIDTAEAKAAPGVIAVYTGADLADTQGVNINAWPITPDQVTPTHLPVVIDHVACAGEIVAVVVARTAAPARDAAEKVDVDYDELPAVLDAREAMKDEVLAHPDLRHEQVGLLEARLRRGGHRRRRRRGHRQGAPATASSSSASTASSASCRPSSSPAPRSSTPRASS